MKKKKSAFTIWRVLFLIAYIGCVAVLIIESCMDGPSSANQSNAVGGAISGVVNDIKGDQTIAINPQKVEITNEITDNTINGKTGSSYQLTYKTTPNNATYQSYTFLSSDNSIATVNETGLIRFIKEGETTVTITNERFKDITASVKVIVTNIKLESINAWIQSDTDGIINPIFNDDKDAYELFDHNQYILKYSSNPLNATDNTVNISVEENPYVTLSEDGHIITHAICDEPIEIKLTCACGEIVNTIKVIVVPIQEIVFDRIYLNDNDNTLETFVNNKAITPKFIAEYKIYDLTTVEDFNDYITTTNTYSTYQLTTEDTDIVEIINNSIKGLTAGTATITATSTDPLYQDKSCTFTVVVNEQPELTDYSIRSNYTYTYQEGKSNTFSISISFLTTDAKYYSINDWEYTSSDESVIQITKQEKTKVTFKILKANAEATITFKINNIEKTAKITTKEPEKVEIKDEETGEITTVTIKDFEIEQIGEKIYEINLDNAFINDNNKIDLSTLYKAIWKDTNDNECTSPTGSFSYIVDPTLGEIQGNYLYPKTPGEIPIAIHFDGYEDKIIIIYVVNPFSIKINDNDYDGSIYNLNVESSLVWEVITNIAINQDFTVIHGGDINDSACYKISSLKHQLISYNDGLVEITITPSLTTANEAINNTIKERYSKIIKIQMNHIEVSKITVDSKITHHDGNIENFTFEKSIYLNDKLEINVNYNEDATISEITYKSSDSSILKISNTGEITILKTGKVTITIADAISGETWYSDLVINNLIEVDESQPIIVTGVEAEYIEETKTYAILNGYSGTIKVNFKDYSTFTSVTYKSSNEKVLTVGKDGKITPLSVGKSTITVTCDDGTLDEPQKVFEVNIEIKRQNAIRDISKFFYQVRKGLGHFGAFLVMGIFSTLTYLLFFRRKHWLWSAPLNIAQGYGVAWLTEFIQKYVPGRSGRMADVWIDFAGFMCAAVIFTLGILGYYLIKYIIKTKKNTRKK